jgi:hypothetical protein
MMLKYYIMICSKVGFTYSVSEIYGQGLCKHEVLYRTEPNLGTPRLVRNTDNQVT